MSVKELLLVGLFAGMVVAAGIFIGLPLRIHFVRVIACFWGFGTC